MVHVEAAARYFTHVYPMLRGACGATLAAAVGRRVTEPGQAERLAWVLDELADCEPQRILDAGCGTGLFSTELARRGHRVTALDISRLMLDATRERAAAEGLESRVQTAQGDIWSWEPAEPFDTVVCMGVLEYYAGAEALLRRLYDWTRGRLLLSVASSRHDARALARMAWLAFHGVHAGRYPTAELVRMMSRLPGADIRVLEMPHTHCTVAVRRGEHDAVGATLRTDGSVSSATQT